MSHRIAPVALEQSSPTTRPMLDALKKGLGMVPNLFATIAQSGAALGGYLAFSDALSKGTLTGREVELLNLYTSELNGCGYCLSAHGALARRFDLNAEQIANARRGRGQNEREDAMLALVQRVVRTGGGGAGAEFERARSAGVSDAAIIEVLAHVASKTFTNAVAQVAQVTLDFPAQPNLPRA